MTAEAFAPAKVNLTLHVIGRRPDGYHLLDSLVAFADVGDRITVRSAPEWGLTVTGPKSADIPTGADNLCLRAAHMSGAPPAAIGLVKNLPAAAGIGGGSADAAAVLRALRAMDGRAIPDGCAALGADVPVCLLGRAARMRGIGDRIDDVPRLPPLHACLVNPGIAVATPAVFAALLRAENAPQPDPPAFADAASCVAWLARQRNDLEDAARSLAPAIGVALGLLSGTDGCRLTRMSGSGATCFGLYDTRPEAEAAADTLRHQRPDWWITPTSLS